MALDAPLAFVIAVTALNGIVAGASLDQSIKQLPERRRIGALAYSTCSRASDLGNGIAWYASIGIGAVVVTIAAALVAFARGVSFAQALPLYGAAALSLLHALATSRAAPILLSQRHLVDLVALRALFDRFERWQTLRLTLHVLAFGATLWALVVAGR
jgi:hypothetical protein